MPNQLMLLLQLLGYAPSQGGGLIPPWNPSPDSIGLNPLGTAVPGNADNRAGYMWSGRGSTPSLPPFFQNVPQPQNYPGDRPPSLTGTAVGPALPTNHRGKPPTPSNPYFAPVDGDSNTANRAGYMWSG
jgi:hypothetical protein